jgi:hypothetical protein
MQIGVAHAAGHDPHKHFVGEWRREVERFDLERSFASPRNSRIW